MSGRTVVVTGAAGFLGSHVVELLSAAGRFEVIATDVAGSPRADGVGGPARSPLPARRPAGHAAVEDLLRGADSVVHLAAVRGKASDAHHARDAYDTNVGATFDLVSLAARHRLRRFVYGSSHLVYGAFEDPHPPPSPRTTLRSRRGLTLYSAGKLAVRGADGGGLRRRRARTTWRCASAPSTGPASTSTPPTGSSSPCWPPSTVASGRRSPGRATPCTGWSTWPTRPWPSSARSRWSTTSGAPSTSWGRRSPPKQLYSTLVAQYGGDPADIAWRDERARYQLVSAERLAHAAGRARHRPACEDGLAAVIDWYRSELRAAPLPVDSGSGPMTRILYLSLSNEKYSTNYFPFLRRSTPRRWRRRARSWSCAAPAWGASTATGSGRPSTPISILDSVVGAEPQGFDAVAIGNILDPGLRDARSMVDIPVLGLGETCMLAACMMGSRFSLVGVNPYFGGPVRGERRPLRAQGAAGGHRVHGADARTSWTPASPTSRGAGGPWRPSRAAARQTLDAGSEVVIPAGGRLTAFLNAQGVREVDGAPVLDGTATLVAMTEAAVRIRAAAGTVVSRRRLFARAPEGVVRGVAAEYAESYGLPALLGLAPGPETHRDPRLRRGRCTR